MSNEHPKDLFSQAIHSLGTVGGFANYVAKLLAGEPPGPKGELTAMVHGQLSAHCRSMAAMSTLKSFDHAGVMALARMSIDGLLMFCYLSERCGKEEWMLRYDLLRLHDTSARIKLVRAWKQHTPYNDLIHAREALLNRIRANTVFLGQKEERRRRLVSGEEIFVSGMRRAARDAGWAEEKFVAVYRYFSAHVHAAPMGCYRIGQEPIDYSSPNERQYGSATLAVEVATACLRRATLRLLASSATAAVNVARTTLDTMREQDAASPIFNDAAVDTVFDAGAPAPRAAAR